MASAALEAPRFFPAGLVRLRRRLPRLPWFAILMLIPVLLCGIFGPLLYLHDPTAINLQTPQMPPVWLEGGSWSYPLGTDQFGRDLLSRLIEGSRVTLVIALSGVLLAAVIGITAGMVAGYFGGLIDSGIMQSSSLASGSRGRTPRRYRAPHPEAAPRRRW